MTSLPPISSLPSLPAAQQTEALDLLFEPSPTIHSLVLPRLPSDIFYSYDGLVDSIFTILSSLPSKSNALHSILGSHPRLGAPKVDSVQSAAEQAKLQQGSREQAEKLGALNAQYEARFPGLRYVVFVNGRGRPEIMKDMERRINDTEATVEGEEKKAIQAMCDIAKDRAKKLAIV